MQAFHLVAAASDAVNKIADLVIAHILRPGVGHKIGHDLHAAETLGLRLIQARLIARGVDGIGGAGGGRGIGAELSLRQALGEELPHEHGAENHDARAGQTRDKRIQSKPRDAECSRPQKNRCGHGQSDDGDLQDHLQGIGAAAPAAQGELTELDERAVA